VSFHKFGEYFPGTGAVGDVGYGKGRNYSLNFPLHDGIDDSSFELIFRAIIEKVMGTFRPHAIVLQCGADSLSGDRLGCFNLSLKGHGAAVEYVKGFNLPLLVLGGGGYTVRNVARCWAYETGLLLDHKMPEEIPYNEFYEYYSPDFQLHITPSNMENLNTTKYLEKTKMQLLEVLRQLPPVSVNLNQTVPRGPPEAATPEPDPDTRMSKDVEDKLIEHVSEFYDGDKDHDKSAREASLSASRPAAPIAGAIAAAAPGAGAADAPPPAKPNAMDVGD